MMFFIRQYAQKKGGNSMPRTKNAAVKAKATRRASAATLEKQIAKLEAELDARKAELEKRRSEEAQKGKKAELLKKLRGLSAEELEALLKTK